MFLFFPSMFPSLLLLLLSSSRTEHRNLILCREHAQTRKVTHSLTVSAHANERWPLTPGAYGKNEPDPNVHGLTVFEACSRRGSEGSVSDALLGSLVEILSPLFILFCNCCRLCLREITHSSQRCGVKHGGCRGCFRGKTLNQESIGGSARLKVTSTNMFTQN